MVGSGDDIGLQLKPPDSAQNWLEGRELEAEIRGFGLTKKQNNSS